jgi:nucleotide-binding universal stress UspA family protein
MRRILLATDGSAGAGRAAEVAATLARAVGGSLLILTAGGNVSADEMKELARAEGNAGDALDALSGQILARARVSAERAGLSDVRAEAGWGDPAEAISRQPGASRPTPS